MSPLSLIKMFVLLVVFGFLALPEMEARTLDQAELLTRNINVDELSAMAQLLNQAPALNSNPEQADHDDDDDDDDLSTLQQNPSQQANLYNDDKPILAAQTNQQHNQQVIAPSSDLKTAASHYHHKHHAKGWLDMGAWTGKKGAFGWHDKHPVGKGRK